jgi:hypothetical protein
MEDNSPDLSEIQSIGQKSAASHDVDEQLGGYGAAESASAVSAEKTPEQLKQELIDAILKQNQELEGQLLTEVNISDREKVYIFNAFPHSGTGGIRVSAGVSSQDGPILFDSKTSEEMGRMRSNSASFSERLLSEGKTTVQEGFLPDWQKAFTVAKELAGRRAEKIRSDRTVLPKALEFVKSQGTSSAQPDTSRPPMDFGSGFDKTTPTASDTMHPRLTPTEA